MRKNTLNVFQLKLKKFELLKTIAFSAPFSPFRGIIRRFVDRESVSFLDVGCGTGGAARALRISQRNGFIIGLDAYSHHLASLRLTALYDGLINADIRYLPFRQASFDSVVCIDVIEHLTKTEGAKLVKHLETTARRQIIISSPVGFVEMNHQGLTEEQAELEKHRAGWTPMEFRSLGYQVRGDCGPRFLPREIAYWLSFVVPLTFFTPESSYHMISAKNMGR